METVEMATLMSGIISACRTLRAFDQ